jgi:hypothetical protein
VSLGEILRQFDDENFVARLLPELGDAEWRERASSFAAEHGEALGEYASASVERFASGAQEEDWLSLVSALNRAADPGVVCLRRMMDWAIARDGKDAKPCAKHRTGGGEIP